MSTVRPGVHQELPAVDSRLVAPEQRYEAHDGRLVYVSPADEPHGTRHSELMALLEAYASEEYDVACDMLTRTSETSDVAPDASVYPAARNPETGGRQLEELAFEVVSTSGLADAGVKAKRLADRGVRRVFAIDVKRQRLLEWSSDVGSWQILGTDTSIEDPGLALPLPAAALVGAAKAGDAIARALLGKRHPLLMAAATAGKAESKAEGKAEALMGFLRARGIPVTDQEAARILSERDSERLDRWIERAIVAGSVQELFEPAARGR